MVVTYEDNGVPKIMEQQFSREVHNSNFENVVRKNLHKRNVREQMTKDFKEICGENSSDNTIGYALEQIRERKYVSQIDRIEFHYGKTLRNFNVRYI